MVEESIIQSINPKTDGKGHGHESVGECSRRVPKDSRHGKMIPALGRQMCEGGATSLEGPSVSTSRPPTKDNSQDPLLLLSPRAKKSQSSSIEDREKGGGACSGGNPRERG